MIQSKGRTGRTQKQEKRVEKDKKQRGWGDLTGSQDKKKRRGLPLLFKLEMIEKL